MKMDKEIEWLRTKRREAAERAAALESVELRYDEALRHAEETGRLPRKIRGEFTRDRNKGRV